MKKLTLSIALAMLAVPGAAAAQDAEGPVACVYDTLGRGEIIAFLELAGRQGSEPTDAERATVTRFNDVRRACQARHAYSEGQSEAAYLYATGRSYYEHSVERLRPRGIDPALIERAVARLDQPAREAVLTGNMQSGIASVIRVFEEAGMRPEDRSSAEWREIGEIFGEGLAGLLFREHGRAQFGR